MSNKNKNNDDEEEQEKDDAAQKPLTGKRVHRRMGDIHEAEESSHLWLVTFTDVMALMLTFFVLLFSMASPTKENWDNVTAAMQSEFNKFYGAVMNRGPQDSLNIDKINFDRALNISYLRALTERVISDSKYLENVTLIPQPGSLIISLPRELLFDPGSAAVKEEGARALYALGGSLSRIRNKIEIIGHADPRPVDAQTGAFDSNWDLSMARAANVAAILENVGYEKDITIHGLSSGRYEDLEGIITDENKRLDLARRVDIVVMDNDGTKQKVFPDDPGG